MFNNIKHEDYGYYSGNSNIIQTLVDCSLDAGNLLLKWLFNIEKENNFNILWKETGMYNHIGNMPVQKGIEESNRSINYFFTIPTGFSIDKFEKSKKEIAQFLHTPVNKIKIELINNMAVINVNKLENVSCNFEDHDFIRNEKELEIPFGINLETLEEVTWKPNDPNTPHLLIAGSTGAGKSTTIYSILAYILEYCFDDTELYIQDVKTVDLPELEPVCKRYNPGTKYATETVKELVEIMDSRYKYIKEKKAKCANKLKEKDKLKSIVYVLEELNAFNPKKDADFYGYLGELLSRGRAANISVITITQSPYATVLPGEFKNNYPAVIGLRTSTSEASKVVCGQYDKLNNLRGKGHGFFFTPGEEIEYQGFNIQEETINNIIKSVNRGLKNEKI